MKNNILNLNDIQKSTVKYNYLILPDGQPHIQVEKPDNRQVVNIVCSLTSMDDIGKLIVAKNALDNLNLTTKELVIPYMLGARQDKRVVGEALTLKCFARIINDLKVYQVLVFHPHSQSTINLIDKAKEIDHTPFVEKAIEDFKPDYLIIPDLGASKNAQKYNRFNLPQIQCYKQRNPKTGKLSGFGVYGEKPEEGSRCLILDDLCDGCGTFMGLADLFNNHMGLYTTHGLYTKGLKSLNEVFDRTYCTNSYRINGLEDIEGFDESKNKIYEVTK